MCDVCKAEGINFLFKNGNKKSLYSGVLYRVFKDSHAHVKLCYVHSIELFRIGERRFLFDHLIFSRAIAKRTTKSAEIAPFSSFGF